MKSFTLLDFAGDESTESLLKTVNEFGLCILPRFVEGGDLAELNVEFDNVLSNESTHGVDKMELNAGRGANVHQYELGDDFPKMRKFFRSEWMQEASDSYWGGPAKLNENIYVMEEVPGTEHVAQDLHFDVQETFKFFLYLNDVTSENGAFSCVPGSHRHTKELRNKLGDEISYEKRELTRDHPFSESDVVPIEGKAGTLIVFTTEVWHRAGKVSSGSRRIMRGHTRKLEEPSHEVENSAEAPGKKQAKRKAARKAARKKSARPGVPKRSFIQRLLRKIKG